MTKCQQTLSQLLHILYSGGSNQSPFVSICPILIAFLVAKIAHDKGSKMREKSKNAGKINEFKAR